LRAPWRSKDCKTNNWSKIKKESERQNMKNSKTAIVGLVIVALLVFVGSAAAQARPTGGAGITASPKLRQMIEERAVSATPGAPAGLNHACPKCKNENVTRVDSTARGAFKPTVTIVKHLCPDCKTVKSNTGTGKATQPVVKHDCTMGDCCATKS
jgi:hypothetical protein